MKLDRSEILENIEDIQTKVDDIGYFGINEHELEVRERIADYIINNFVLFGVVKPLKSKNSISFGVWKIKCKDIDYIDKKLVKYKGNLMSYEELEKEYHKIKHTL